MSSAELLEAMRSSGSTRASAARAGLSEGKGLSVTAIKVRGISLSQHLGIDAIGRHLAGDECNDVVDDDVGHLLAHFDHRTAEMGCHDHVPHCKQSRRNLGLMFEDIETSTRDLALLERVRERGLIDNSPARGIDQECGRFHQRKLAPANLMASLGRERGMDRDEIRFRKQAVKRHVSYLDFAFEIDGLPARSPIEHPHVEAMSAARDRAPNAPAAADQADGLAVDRGTREVARLRAWKLSLVNKA